VTSSEHTATNDTPLPAGARPGTEADPAEAATGLAQAAAAAIVERTGLARHDVAVVLGSGWRPAADVIGEAVAEVPMGELPGFAAPSVVGHGGTVRSVAAGDQRVLVMLGRTHLYEGKGVARVVHGVRTAAAAGCRVVVLTNAAGGIRPGLRPGQPVLVRDHINLTGQSPLTGGPPPDGYPSRFADLTGLYAPRLRALACAADPDLTDGVYAALPGPNYETPAEIGMLAALGADLVGMSTALEAIAARHLGADVLGISLVTNLAAGLAAEPLSHQEVTDTARREAGRIGDLLAGILPRL
jgi:purine-nucleoside phosphorylase